MVRKIEELTGATADKVKDRKMFLAWCKLVLHMHAHTQMCSRPGLPLPFHWGRETFPSFNTFLFQHCKTMIEAFPDWHEIISSQSSKMLPSHPSRAVVRHHSRHSLISRAFLLSVSEVMLSKKASFVVGKARWQRRFCLLVFGLLETPLFFFLFVLACRLCW